MELTSKLLREINATISLNTKCDDKLSIEMGIPSIDSRKITPGGTFFGLNAEERDGNDYFEDAIKNGAKILILNNTHREKFEKSEIVSKSNAVGIFVNDTRVALKKIGFYNRLSHSIPFIAVTGSNGKTTTKELIYAVLSEKFKVYKTEGNFNNDLGLPMELMKVTKQHEAAVFELGMSAPHEIENLAALVLPRIGIITCVGPAHIEFLKTLKNIANAKAELIPKIDTQGALVLNYDNNYTRKMASLFSGKVVGYSIDNKSAKLRAERLNINESGFYDFWCVVKANGKKYEPFHVKLPLPGKHNVLNCLAAISVGLEFGIPIENIANAINNFNGVKKRMELVKLGSGITVLNDCYNANPLSMKSAIETIAELPNVKRRVAVLGDMLELGTWSARAHGEIGKIAQKSGINILITVGEKSRQIDEAAISAGMDEKNVIHFDSSEETAKKINEIITSGDLVLIKGSRRMKLENVFEALQGAKK